MNNNPDVNSPSCNLTNCPVTRVTEQTFDYCQFLVG